MSIRLERCSDNYYKFLDENNNIIIMFKYSSYPNCCSNGILSNFGGYNNRIKDNADQIENYIIEIMDEQNINQLLIADIKDEAGYVLAENLKSATPLNMVFNKNSGNYVYMFSIYNETEMRS